MTLLRLRLVISFCSDSSIENLTVFQAEKLEKEAASNPNRADKIGWFLQGTLYVDPFNRACQREVLIIRRYPDVIESLSFKGPSQTIKTHHNVVSIST